MWCMSRRVSDAPSTQNRRDHKSSATPDTMLLWEDSKFVRVSDSLFFMSSSSFPCGVHGIGIPRLSKTDVYTDFTFRS